ncbi:MAG: helix-turn-helix transcriptional regulator [Pirellulales bacterium]|nr:helix-turn-helix transcriptional regulator [Pirellulales bacterium]
MASKPLHRVRTVRVQQGISLRTVARGRHVSLRQVRREESPHSDLNLSTIYQWQSFLEVPVADLLVENQDPLSRPVMERARMVKLMKTIATIRERATDGEVKQLSESLFDQAVEMMPELIDVQPWQRVGQRRTLDEFGRIAEHQLPDDFFAG